MSATWTVGQRVCIVGWGTAGTVHTHHVVTRLTKLYVYSGGPGKPESRHHRLRDDASPGGTSYGGTNISATCQQSNA